jgi:hypothetical protein
MIVFSTYQLIIASLNEMSSEGILAKASNDIVKILECFNM